MYHNPLNTESGEFHIDGIQYDEKENDLITVYYGQDVSEEQAEKLRERLEEQFDGADVELHNGGQPLYYYILSVEWTFWSHQLNTKNAIKLL